MTSSCPVALPVAADHGAVEDVEAGEQAQLPRTPFGVIMSESRTPTNE